MEEKIFNLLQGQVIQDIKIREKYIKIIFENKSYLKIKGEDKDIEFNFPKEK